MSVGDVGYIITGVKISSEVKVGDTITHVKNPCDKAISGFEDVKPMVFAGIYPLMRMTMRICGSQSKNCS